MQYHATRKGILGNTLGSLDQALDGGDMAAQLEHTRTEHSTLYLNHILVTINHAIHGDGIAIGHLEVRHVELVYIIYGIALATLAHQANRLLVGIASKTACIFQQGRNALVLTHLVEHRALHITGNTYQAIVRTHLDDIVIMQHDITCQTTIQDILVDIHNGYQFSSTIYLDVTQGTEIADTTGTIQGVEHGSKGTEGIGTRGLYLAHHIDHDGTGLTNGELQVTAGILAA